MALDTLLIDTSAYSAFKRGHDEALDFIRSAGDIILPAVVVGELLAGFERGTRRDRNRDELDSFCAAPRVRVASISSDTAERYAVIYRHLRGAGTPVPTYDLWIAASAMEHGAVVLTLDGHFSLMPQVISVVLH